EVSDAGKEAPRLEREAVAERRRLHVRLLDRDAVVGGERDRRGAAQPRVDARRKAELGFGKAEAARSRPDLRARRQRKAADRVERGVARGVRVEARKNQRDGGVEG